MGFDMVVIMYWMICFLCLGSSLTALAHAYKDGWFGVVEHEDPELEEMIEKVRLLYQRFPSNKALQALHEQAIRFGRPSTDPSPAWKETAASIIKSISKEDKKVLEDKSLVK